MACIGCQRKIKNMEDKIKKLGKSFDANRIAAMLGISKHRVEEVLSAKTPEPTPIPEPTPTPVARRRKSKSIEDETI